MALFLEKLDCIYNTKTKVYRTGATSTTYCNYDVFRDSSAESIDKRKAERMDADIRQKQSIERVEAVRQIDESMSDISAHDYRDLFQKPGRVLLPDSTETRLDSLKRAIDSIFDIVYQNDWSYFVTFTLRPDDSLDRTDPAVLVKPILKWLKNQVSRHGLRYILVAEYHKNGGIHLHLLVNDVFSMVDSGTKSYKCFKKPMRDCVAISRGLNPADGRTVFNIPAWKFGFSTAIAVYGSPDRLAYYMTKYITKDLKKIFGKFYWSSKNIVRKPTIILSHTNYPDVVAAEVAAPNSMLKFKYETNFLRNEIESLPPELQEGLFEDLAEYEKGSGHETD